MPQRTAESGNLAAGRLLHESVTSTATTTASTAVAASPRTGWHVPAMLALALGGFGIGTTEFVTMGLLPDIAGAFSVSEPTAGHAVSA